VTSKYSSTIPFIHPQSSRRT